MPALIGLDHLDRSGPNHIGSRHLNWAYGLAVYGFKYYQPIEMPPVGRFPRPHQKDLGRSGFRGNIEGP
jgi:hypothetical protein